MHTIGWGLSIVLLLLFIVGSGGAQASAPGAGIFVADAGNNRIVRIDDMTGAGWTTLCHDGCQAPKLAEFGARHRESYF